MTALKVDAEMNVGLKKSNSAKTARRDSHKQVIFWESCIPKPLISDANSSDRKTRSLCHKTRSIKQLMTVIFRMNFVWHYSNLCPRLSLTNAVSSLWYRLLAAKSNIGRRFGHDLGSHIVVLKGPMITLRDLITSKDYDIIFADYVHSIVQCLFTNGDGVFQDGNAPVRTFRIVLDSFCDNECDLSHLP